MYCYNYVCENIIEILFLCLRKITFLFQSVNFKTGTLGQNISRVLCIVFIMPTKSEFYTTVYYMLICVMVVRLLILVTPCMHYITFM